MTTTHHHGRTPEMTHTLTRDVLAEILECAGLDDAAVVAHHPWFTDDGRTYCFALRRSVNCESVNSTLVKFVVAAGFVLDQSHVVDLFGAPVSDFTIGDHPLGGGEAVWVFPGTELEPMNSPGGSAYDDQDELDAIDADMMDRMDRIGA